MPTAISIVIGSFTYRSLGARIASKSPGGHGIPCISVTPLIFRVNRPQHRMGEMPRHFASSALMIALCCAWSLSWWDMPCFPV